MLDGEGIGTAIIWPGTWFARLFALFVRWFLWQGKVFDAQNGRLRDRVTPFGIRGINATVAPGKSRFDQQACTVIDYSETSFIARMVRDEIREVAPGLYLGKVFLWGKPSIHFSVSFQFETVPTFWRRVIAIACAALLVLAICLGRRFTSNRPVTYDNPAENFKYGSTGGEISSGLPYSLWKLLPEMFPQYLPGKGLKSVGFIYEKDANGKERDLPIGVSRRTYQGIDRVFLNCAVCHAGTVRDTPQSEPRIIIGMGSNTVDLERFQRFLTACVKDGDFNADRIIPEVAKRGSEGWLNRMLLRFIGLDQMRQRLLVLDQRFRFLDGEPEFGPGRFDTFNPPKALLNFRIDNLSAEERVGVCDFPSVWYQRKRRGMWLHWDGNNNRVEERNRSASFGTGATPPTLDRQNIKRIEDFLLDAYPPPYPYHIDQALVMKGALVYAQHCAACHGKNGVDFAGEYVGTVTPIEKIATDPCRLDSYTEELCVNQNLLYAGYGDERFSHFRKTFGYANAPLDGVWSRAPYLHNGSVPTLRDLLEPAANRPKQFYRGYDVFDQIRVGFVANVAEENGHKFFLYRTVYPDGAPKAGQSIPGNGSFGHEGWVEINGKWFNYGTDLAVDEKDALVEYLKTF